MENHDENEFQYGLHSADKVELFDKGLSQISNQHANYFTQHNTVLSDYYVLLRNSDRIVFGFKENTPIDENIKAQCIELFRNIFETEDQ